MKKYYVGALISICFALLASCQTFSNDRFFSLGTSDVALTSSVNNALLSNPDLSTVRVHVETQKGTVFLSGYVKTIRQSDTAGDVARKVPGVKSVQNELIVRK